MKRKFLKINAFLHLWLGLLSGLVVFILGLTGCILAFQQEIEDITEPWRRVVQNVTYHDAPKEMAKVLLDSLPDSDIATVKYLGRHRSVAIDFEHQGKRKTAFIDPYEQSILKIKEQTIGFFPVVLHLHIRLLLPGKVGHGIISYATVIYIILLLGGLILWWPKKWNKRQLKNALSLKWKAGGKRVNYDLHNVFGFYSLLPSLIIACTGIFISLSWFTKSVYWISSSGQQLPVREAPLSKATGKTLIDPLLAVDSVWHLLGKEKQRSTHSLSFILPKKDTDVVTVTDNPNPATAHLAVIRHVDRYSFQFVPMPHYWQKDTELANTGDWIGRYNYDVHVGRIGGLPGKLLAFIISAICTSLPITGFLIWYNKKWRKKKKH